MLVGEINILSRSCIGVYGAISTVQKCGMESMIFDVASIGDRKEKMNITRRSYEIHVEIQTTLGALENIHYSGPCGASCEQNI